MSVVDFQRRVEELGRVSGGGGEGYSLEIVTSAAKDALARHASEFLELRSAHHYGRGAALRKKTSCQVRRDLLVQVLQFSSLAHDGSIESAMVFREPLEVDGGKTAEGLSSLCLQNPCMCMRLGGNTFVKVRHIVCDRGVPENVMHFLSGKWLECSLQALVVNKSVTSEDEALQIDAD
eukprot:6471798-Amphidinium_carterae.1